MLAMASHQQADALFKQLVNTDNLNTGNTFASNNGNIYIKANQRLDYTSIVKAIYDDF